MQAADDEVAHLVGRQEDLVDRDLVVARVGQAEDDPVVGGHRLHRQAEPLLDAGLEGDRPWLVHPRAEGREDAQPPVADLVAEALDDDRLVVGDGPRGLGLLVEVGHEVVGRPLVEAVLLAQLLGHRLGAARPVGPLTGLPDERADGPPELQGSAGAVAPPERHLGRLARRRRDHDPLVGDLLDAPARRAEQEHVARAALVDHLLVELADPGAVGQEHPEQAAVGDRAPARDGDGAGAVAGGQGAAAGTGAVPGDAGPQALELLRRVAAVEQVEDVVQHGVGELGVGCRPPHERRQVVDRPRLDGAHGHDLLRQHVERVARVARRLDLAIPHALHDHGGLDEVAAVLREDRAAAGLADVVAGPAHPLQAPGDRARRRDLDHQVDRAHVDAQLEGAGGHEALQASRLQLVLDGRAAARRDREPWWALTSSSSASSLRPGGHPLGQPAGVDEDDRRPVGPDELEDPRVDGGPDARALGDGDGRGRARPERRRPPAPPARG